MLLKKRHQITNISTIATFLLLIISANTLAQDNDTIKTYDLNEIIIVDYKTKTIELLHMDPVIGTYITAGKRTRLSPYRTSRPPISRKKADGVVCKNTGSI